MEPKVRTFNHVKPLPSHLSLSPSVVVHWPYMSPAQHSALVCHHFFIRPSSMPPPPPFPDAIPNNSLSRLIPNPPQSNSVETSWWNSSSLLFLSAADRNGFPWCPTSCAFLSLRLSAFLSSCSLSLKSETTALPRRSLNGQVTLLVSFTLRTLLSVPVNRQECMKPERGSER